MAVKIRKPAPLSPAEVEMLTRLRTAGSWQHETLRRVAGDDALTSEASALHALVDLRFQRRPPRSRRCRRSSRWGRTTR